MLFIQEHLKQSNSYLNDEGLFAEIEKLKKIEIDGLNLGTFLHRMQQAENDAMGNFQNFNKEINIRGEWNGKLFDHLSTIG